MPVKLGSLFKPRNVRTIILLLVLITLVFALYQLILGSASETGPTIFVPLETNSRSHKYQEKIVETLNQITKLDGSSKSRPHQQISKKNNVPSTELNLIPRYNKGFASAAAKYEKDGRCPKSQILFRPDIDATEFYPDLEFDVIYLLIRVHFLRRKNTHSSIFFL